MLELAKIFHFEMAHAIHGYEGPCKHIHGHSYELHVSVGSATNTDGYIPSPGFVIDFKEIKKLVGDNIISKFDHKLLLSNAFLQLHPGVEKLENLVRWESEPTAENLLQYFREVLAEKMPTHIKLLQLKLFETKDSYAVWHL
jgi:6-pyruvoyltetrahydropterin/6-carboxytetrahydropterin synthase